MSHEAAPSDMAVRMGLWKPGASATVEETVGIAHGSAASREVELRIENQRLRDLYENAVGNRKRFGWTINHLLECEKALATVEAAASEAMAERDRLRSAIEDHRAAAPSRNHASVRDQELWEALDA